MFTKIGTVTVGVSDQDKALDFTFTRSALKRSMISCYECKDCGYPKARSG